METINKNAVMKRAWKIFRGNSEYSYSISSSLERAWWIEKQNSFPMEKTTVLPVARTEFHPSVNYNPQPVSQEAYNSFYCGCTYFGD